jgi:hypothetical protein
MESESGEELTFRKGEKGVDVVIGGTLEKLVERLTYESFADPNYTVDFLNTYRYFTTAPELLELIIARYWLPTPTGLSKEDEEVFEKQRRTPIRLRVVGVLLQWIDKYWHEWAASPPLLSCLNNFIAASAKTGNAALSDRLQKALKRRLDSPLDPPLEIVFPHPPPETLLEKKGKSENFNIFNVHPKEMARQLTLLEFELLSRVKQWELFGTEWIKKEKETKAPNVTRFTQWFNRTSDWVATELVSQSDSKQRVAVLARFIEIAEHCFELQNYNGTIEILAGLQMPSVYNLQDIWGKLSNKHIETVEELMNITTARSNFSAYRALLEKKTPPCVPYLGLYLGDLVSMESREPDKISEGKQINFNKFRQISSVIRKLRAHQDSPYNLRAVPAIQQYVRDARWVGEDERNAVLREEKLAQQQQQLQHTHKRRAVESVRREEEQCLKVRVPNECEIRLMPLKSGVAARDLIKEFMADVKRQPNSPQFVFYNENTGKFSGFPTLVLSTSPSSRGRLIAQTEIISELAERDEVLELWPDPEIVQCAFSETGNLDPSSLSRAEIWLSPVLQLVSMIYVIQRVFQIPRYTEFIFLRVDMNDPQAEPKILHSNANLSSQQFEIQRHLLVLLPLRKLALSTSLAKRFSQNPEKQGFLLCQSKPRGKFAGQNPKRTLWFILAESLLFVFQNERERLPEGVLALENHSVVLLNDTTFRLKHTNSSFSSSSEYHDMSGNDFLNWFYKIRSKTLNDRSQMEGYMIVKANNAVKRRWCVLRGVSSSNSLSIFKSQKSKSPDTEFDLTGCTQTVVPIPPEMRDKKSTCNVQILLKSRERELIVTALTSQEHQWWSAAFTLHGVADTATATNSISPSEVGADADEDEFTDSSSSSTGQQVFSPAARAPVRVGPVLDMHGIVSSINPPPKPPQWLAALLPEFDSLFAPLQLSPLQELNDLNRILEEIDRRSRK